MNGRSASERLMPGESRLFIIYHLRRMWPLLLISLLVPFPNAWVALGVSVLALVVYAAWQHLSGNLFFGIVHVRIKAMALQQVRESRRSPTDMLREAVAGCHGIGAVRESGRVQVAPRDLVPMVEQLLRLPPEMGALLVVKHVAASCPGGMGLPNVSGKRLRRSLLAAVASAPTLMPARVDLAVALFTRCVLLQTNIARAARMLAECGRDEMPWLPPGKRLPSLAETRQRVVAELTFTTGDLAAAIMRRREYRRRAGR